MTPQEKQIVQDFMDAVKTVIEYREHWCHCSIFQTEFCDCGLREDMNRVNEAGNKLNKILNENS